MDSANFMSLPCLLSFVENWSIRKLINDKNYFDIKSTIINERTDPNKNLKHEEHNILYHITDSSFLSLK